MTLTARQQRLLADAPDRNALIVGAQHACWRAGNLSFLRHAGQDEAERRYQDAQRRGIRRFVAAIARRWGKSWWACTKACEVALAGPRRRIPYAAATAHSLRQFVLPIMRSIIQTAPEELRPEVVGTEIRFRNGSAVVMQGCEDVVKADRLRGPEAHMAIVDEAGFIPVLKYVVESVLMYQLATTDGMMLLTSSPPESPAHQFSVYRTDAMARGAYMHATIHDAPHLTPEAIQNLCNETLGGAKSATWRREALAEFIVDPTKAIVPEFSEQASLDAEREKDPDWLPIVREVERPSHFHAYSVGDLGYVDLTVILFAYWHFELAAIVVEDELVCEKTTSDEIQRRAALIEAKLWNGSGIVGKPERAIDAPRITVADMSRLQEVGSAASPEATEAHQEDWGIAWNQDLHAGVNKLRLDVGYRRFIVHPRCTVLRSHLESGIWNEKKTSFGKSGEMGHFDAVAAAVYLSRTVDRAKNPFPVVRPSHYEQWVRPEAKTSEWGHTRKQRR